MANNTPRAPSHLESTEIKDEIKTLKEKENNIVINIKDIIKSDDELIAAYDNIKSIIGIGELGAIVLLHLFLKYPDANKKQIISLVGLDLYYPK